MKESITKFDLEAAFKALDEIEIPAAEKGIKANKPALTEIFSRKTKFDALMEEYYDINNLSELDDAKEAREAEVAQAKLARIEKIVDLDAESPEDLLPSYVGKFIMQCPQCMTLFYKDPEDVEASEEDPETVNVNEICQHCGNDAGYTLIGKVGEATEEEQAEYNEEETVDVTSTDEDEEISEESVEDTENSEEDFDLGSGLDEIDLDIEDDEEAEKAEESFNTGNGEQVLVEQLTEETDLEVSADEFEALINSPEFKKPVSDREARAMINELEGDKEEVNESVSVNNETLKYAVINSDGTYAGVPCTSEEEARELAAQQEGRIIVELGALREGALDKLKNGIGRALNSRNAKADWILANAKEDYNNVKADTKGQLVPDEKNQRFRTFVVVGFTDKYSNGKTITMAPSFNNKDLVIGNKAPQEKKSYADADKLAKGWSMVQGNGPAFIYLAKSKDDSKAVFLCEYFKGKLENDQLEKYYKVVKDHLKGAKLIAKSGGMTDEQDSTAEDDTNGETSANESLAATMAGMEDLQEDVLESLISSTLIESYGNVAGFRLKDCSYLGEQFIIEGVIHFTSGNTRKTAYTFTEAYASENGKVTFCGLNEKLGTEKQFTITGYTDDNKTFITESFKRSK